MLKNPYVDVVNVVSQPSQCGTKAEHMIRGREFGFETRLGQLDFP